MNKKICAGLLSILFIHPCPARAGLANMGPERIPVSAGLPGTWGAYAQASKLDSGQISALERLLAHEGVELDAIQPSLAAAQAPAEQAVQHDQILLALARRYMNQAHSLAALQEAEETVQRFGNPHAMRELGERLEDILKIEAAIPGLTSQAKQTMAQDQTALRAMAQSLLEGRKDEIPAPLGPQEDILPSSVGDFEPVANRTPLLQTLAALEPAGKLIIPHAWAPKHLDTETFAGEKWPVFGAPTLFDVPALLAKLVGVSAKIKAAFYDFDLENVADAWVQAAKDGRQQRLIGNYTSWFPHVRSQESHGDAFKERSAAMQTVIDHFDPKNTGTFSLSILKGYGGIGINHNKFILAEDEHGDKILFVASFNFSHTSQNNHWEVFAMTKDPRRIALVEAYFEWMSGLARLFNEDLEPEDPREDISGIPRDQDPSLIYRGEKFPVATFSPMGGSLEAWVKAAKLIERAIFQIVFAYVPPDAFEQEILAVMGAAKAGFSARLLMDVNQVHNAQAALRFLQTGGEVRLTAGPDEAPYNPKNPHNIHSKQHIKALDFDNGAFVKAMDSANISNNAVGVKPKRGKLRGNFETSMYWTGVLAQLFHEYADQVMWPLGYEPTAKELEDIIGGNRRRQESQGIVIPWSAPRDPE